MTTTQYVFLRSVLYAFLWAASVVELGITGWRVHHTKSTAGFYDPIVVELVVTAALTLLWAPLTVHLRAGERDHASRPLRREACGSALLWVMWLVGAAIATHKWPTSALAGPGSDGHLLLALVAFAWIPYGALSLALVLVLMHFAALGAPPPAVSAKAAEAGQA